MLFSQAHAATLIVVTNTSDGAAPGPAGSLRRAISDAVAGDTITFSVPANSTVSLTSGELLINKELTINGPGANLLSIQRSAVAGNFRIFTIAANFSAAISGVTIANGNLPTDFGGGILNLGALTLANSTISGNSAGSGGGGIQNNGNGLAIIKVTISGNSSGTGGGFHNTSTATIANSTISGNMATSGNGGGIYNTGTVTTTNSTITENSASGNGGGVYRGSGTVNARNTIIANNTATTGFDVYGQVNSQGYNLIRSTDDMTIVGTTTGNQVNVDPLLGPLQDNGGPTRTHALLSSSPAIEGGQSSGSTTDQRGFARPVDSPSLGNASGGDGSDIGAYEVQPDVLPGCDTINRIVNNNNDSGTDSLRAIIANVCAGSTITFAPSVTGAINLTSTELLINKSLTINGPGANLLSVQRSASAGDLRIFRIAPASVIASISGLTIANGSAPNDGTSSGGISNLGTLTLTNCTVSGNTNNKTSGGGILNSGGQTLTIINSTISGNSTTAGFAGGIYNYASLLTITNSTISGNSATEPFNGIGLAGGILNSNGGTVILTNSTIAGNTGQFRAGGIRNTSDSTVRAKNTIIALNTSPTGPDVDGALTSQGFNLIGNNSGATIAPAIASDQIGTAGSPIDPLLGSLQDNGGPTFTLALLSGSTAIDKGHASGSYTYTDQRDFPRPTDQSNVVNVSGGDGSDIGAFEFGSLPLHVVSIMRAGNNIVVSFEAVQGKTYRLERKLNMSDTMWQSVNDLTPSANGSAAIPDNGGFSLGKAFYHVRLLP